MESTEHPSLRVYRLAVGNLPLIFTDAEAGIVEWQLAQPGLQQSLKSASRLTEQNLCGNKAWTDSLILALGWEQAMKEKIGAQTLEQLLLPKLCRKLATMWPVDEEVIKAAALCSRREEPNEILQQAQISQTLPTPKLMDRSSFCSHCEQGIEKEVEHKGSLRDEDQTATPVSNLRPNLTDAWSIFSGCCWVFLIIAIVSTVAVIQSDIQRHFQNTIVPDSFSGVANGCSAHTASRVDGLSLTKAAESGKPQTIASTNTATPKARNPSAQTDRSMFTTSQTDGQLSLETTGTKKPSAKPPIIEDPPIAAAPGLDGPRADVSTSSTSKEGQCMANEPFSTQGLMEPSFSPRDQVLGLGPNRASPTQGRVEVISPPKDRTTGKQVDQAPLIQETTAPALPNDGSTGFIPSSGVFRRSLFVLCAGCFLLWFLSLSCEYLRAGGSINTFNWIRTSTTRFGALAHVSSSHSSPEVSRTSSSSPVKEMKPPYPQTISRGTQTEGSFEAPTARSLRLAKSKQNTEIKLALPIYEADSAWWRPSNNHIGISRAFDFYNPMDNRALWELANCWHPHSGGGATYNGQSPMEVLTHPRRGPEEVIVEFKSNGDDFLYNHHKIFGRRGPALISVKGKPDITVETTRWIMSLPNTSFGSNALGANLLNVSPPPVITSWSHSSTEHIGIRRKWHGRDHRRHKGNGGFYEAICWYPHYGGYPCYESNAGGTIPGFDMSKANVKVIVKIKANGIDFLEDVRQYGQRGLASVYCRERLMIRNLEVESTVWLMDLPSESFGDERDGDALLKASEPPVISSIDDENNSTKTSEVQDNATPSESNLSQFIFQS